FAGPPYRIPYMVSFTDPSLITLVASEYLFLADAGINRGENLKLARTLFSSCIANTHFHPMCQYGLRSVDRRTGSTLNDPLAITDPFHLAEACTFVEPDNGFRRTANGWEIRR
ncbi:MAG: hypothetical protein KDK37_19365, partial [Leptospiraceae bacterium]|nr:hypothetical protein [Leptospiraceae bacterium]